MSLEDANCLSRARLRVPNYPTRALQPQPGTFSAHPMPVDVSGCYQREPSSGAMTRPHRVRMSAIWSICAGQHSIRRHLNAAIFGYVVVVTTSDMGIFAPREPGRDWEGVAMLRGAKTLASMESKATKPMVETRQRAQGKAMHGIRAYGALFALGSEYRCISPRCRCSFVWWVRKLFREFGTGGQGEAPRDGEDVAGWGFLSWYGLGPARMVVGPRRVWELRLRRNSSGQD